MKANIVLLPGDGIGPEVTQAAKAALGAIAKRFGHEFAISEALMGGAAIDATGEPLPAKTLAACQEADAVFLGAVGGPKWDKSEKRPEQGLLAIRKALGLYANLRPAVTHPALYDASPIKADRLEGVDIMVVRELTGGIYFGEKEEGTDAAWDRCAYSGEEVDRVLHQAAKLAKKRGGKVTMVDKANVLATSRLWRRRTEALFAEHYPELELEFLLVDAAAMHLLSRPASFDVLVTENLFGDILTDEAAMLVGSLGMLPSASLGNSGPGLFEPCHGSAPDIAGQDKANPFAALLSSAMLLELGLGLTEEAQILKEAVYDCLTQGQCTGDLGGKLGTKAATQAVLARII
ncbi:MAG: 3-isopropylmalate dehydrogenase [Pseudomonadota bacterium]|uniref:3-isopropylmalate dehydrogenase n=1 Tax=Gallaecimonas pentaromativorans TaxID=584787 RepID=UPI00067E97D6|nr:3-isopropylmalate dehydrogenase [Gallaecimonas pentaromativorans]MED5525134.1 3-isopropylmalate dehydrogenase [Pseudomonadota bacterium]